MSGKLRKTDEEWRAQLSPEQYCVTREAGTEPAFTGMYYDLKDKGSYRCVCCDAALFSSDKKFDSGSGWPSFWAAVEDGCLDLHKDASHGMIRTEVTCGRCDAHLGHLFDDGPKPTGERYCINSLALRFEPHE